MWADILLTGIAILALVLIVLAYARGWGKGGAGSFASLTAFHDFQPKDKRDAITVVIEQKAGKRLFGQSDEGGPAPPEGTRAARETAPQSPAEGGTNRPATQPGRLAGREEGTQG